MKQWQDFETQWVSRSGDLTRLGTGEYDAGVYADGISCRGDLDGPLCGTGGQRSGFPPVWGGNIVFQNKRLMHCKHCGTNSMIPDSTDKILALVCPQCGGALHE